MTNLDSPFFHFARDLHYAQQAARAAEPTVADLAAHRDRRLAEVIEFPARGEGS